MPRIQQKMLNLGVKSPSFPRTTFGASSPSSFRYILTPPYPDLRFAVSHAKSHQGIQSTVRKQPLTSSAHHKYQSQIRSDFGGRIFYAPPPPHHGIYPSRGGGCVKEGVQKKTTGGAGVQNTYTHPSSPKLLPYAHSSPKIPLRIGLALKALTSINKEVRPFFLSDTSIWSFPSVSSLSGYSIGDLEGYLALRS